MNVSALLIKYLFVAFSLSACLGTHFHYATHDLPAEFTARLTKLNSPKERQTFYSYAKANPMKGQDAETGLFCYLGGTGPHK